MITTPLLQTHLDLALKKHCLGLSQPFCASLPLHWLTLVLLMDCLSSFPLGVQECAEAPNHVPRNEHFLRNVTVQPSTALPLRFHSPCYCYFPRYFFQTVTDITHLFDRG